MFKLHFFQQILKDDRNNDFITTTSNFCLFLLFIIGVIITGCSPVELKWNDKENYRWANVSIEYWDDTGFEQLSPSNTNIHFENKITEKEITQNRVYLNGSGVAAGDINGDGLVDLYFARLNGPNKLYKNSGGMEFEDITKEANVAHDNHHSTGAVFADVNGDGKLDLLVTSIEKHNALYINKGKGQFKLKKNSGLGSANGSMSMTLADIEGDGDLDLYITNYKEKSVKDNYTFQELSRENILTINDSAGTKSYSLVPPFDKHYRLFKSENKFAGIAQKGKKDELYLNNGGTFKKITDTKNIFLDEDGNPYGLQSDWGLTAKFQDLNNDGLPDLYVCNDFFSPDRVWINQGKGIFKLINPLAIRNSSFGSMAVDFADINQDGLLDIYTAEMLSPSHSRRLSQVGLKDPTPTRNEDLKSRPQYNRNSMYLKRKDGTYAEISYFTGTAATGWSWATKFMDVNLDGLEDLIINTGYTYDILDIDTQLQMVHKGMNLTDNYDTFIKKTPPLNLSNKILINEGDLTFTDKSSQLGFDELDVSHGMATADLDNDGDLDLITNRLNRTATVYENKTTAPRILVTLKGKSPNTKGTGAKVVLQNNSNVQKREITAGGDYLSGSSPEVMFAANKDVSYKIIVKWNSGIVTKIDNVKANRIYEVREESINSAKNANIAKKKSLEKKLFKDVSSRIPYQHHEDSFNDFKVQSLLPKKLSRLGPGLSWIDFNHDNKNDLFVSSGKGGSMGIFENLGNGRFKSVSFRPLSKLARGDQTAVIGWKEYGQTMIFVGNANYEQGKISASSANMFTIRGNNLAKNDSIPGIFSTTGPLAMADYDYDGDLDLFVGGRLVPGQYPMSATSRIFKNDHGEFQLDQANTRLLNKIGLVTSAEFTDYDQNGYLDLLISTEWGSLHLFKNQGGAFNEVTRQVNLGNYKGMWNSVSTGDFNNDGLPDIIATNIGLNSPYQLKNGNSLRMYYKDLKNNGRIDIIEAHANKEGDYVPIKPLYKFNNIPPISTKVKSHKRFANITMKELFGRQLSKIPYKEINTLQSMIFINSNSGFESSPLPKIVQFSAAYDASIADFNNDGDEDVFLSQNFFSYPRGKSRLDAGRGLILEGDGEGKFSPIPGSKSGIKIYGEQRGAALADFNMDGKIDLSVTQNNAPVKLYLNQAKHRGIRIKLKGPSNNNLAIGSSIRLIYADGSKGPLREIKAGSGYWSQDSATQVLGAGKKIQAIVVSWFDGIQQTINVQENKKSYIIPYPESN